MSLDIWGQTHPQTSNPVAFGNHVDSWQAGAGLLLFGRALEALAPAVPPYTHSPRPPPSCLLPRPCTPAP